MRIEQEKKRLRREIGRLRDGISPQDRRRKSEQISRNFFSLPEYGPEKTVFIYRSFRSEVETATIITAVLDNGGFICIPASDPVKKSMKAIQVFDIERECRPGFKGIEEPDPLLGAKNVVDPLSIEIIVLPGLVFDAAGGRLGYGGGFYDRYLQEPELKALKVGLAFELQLVHSVPTGIHDVAVDVILTEKRILRTGKG